MGRRDKYEIRRNVLVDWDLLKSEAFKTLSATGIRVILRFLQKRTWEKTGRNKKPIFRNGGIAFTYGEAEAMDISKSQFHTVLKKLYEVGFIDIEHQGGGLARDFSRYRISERWRDYGTNTFKYMEKKRVLWSGFDVRSRMEQKKKATESRSCQLRKVVAIDNK